MFKYVLFIILVFSSFSLYGEENLLTLKQQLDRLQRDVNDLSKVVFQKNIRNTDESSIKSENSMNFSAFDMRIYDLEKDIKNLNSNFEDLVFQVDEIKILFEELSIKVETTLINKIEKVENSEISSAEINEVEDTEHTLGTLKINSDDLSDDNTKETINNLENENKDLSPDEQFQLAFDLLRSQKFDQAKNSLREFIVNNTNNDLAGSAHYWLGEIHLLKKEYREAALIYAEGYQKYPSNTKAPDNLYKLAVALLKIDKTNEACNTLNKFVKEYKDHKLFAKTNSKITELKCE